MSANLPAAAAQPARTTQGMFRFERLALGLRLAAIPAIGLVALAALTGLTHAQPPPNRQPISPQLAPGGPGAGGPAGADTFAGVQIWTERTNYNVGDSMEYGNAVPFPGYVSVYDRLPNGSERVLNAFWEY